MKRFQITYNQDFFTHAYWKKLPQSTREYLSELEPPELLFLLNDDKPKNVPPLFLLAFRYCTKTFSMSRQVVDPTYDTDVSRLLKTDNKDDANASDTASGLHFPFANQDQKQMSSMAEIPREGKSLGDKFFRRFSIREKTNGIPLVKKSSKPLTEKRRRDRINKCLVQLKNIIFRARGKEEKKFARLEKADILEMTISHLMEIHGQATEHQTLAKELPGQLSNISNHDNKGQGHYHPRSNHKEDGQYLPSNHCLRKHVKPKKQHEIMRLGKTLHLLGTATKCPFIVDVGAGQGHLSRLLTFEHGFKVTTVEAAGCHAPKAKKFDRDAQNLIRKKKLKSSTQEKKECGDSGSTDNLPEHVTCFIQSDTSKSEFLEIVQQSFSKCDHDKSYSVHLSENTQSTSSTSKLNTQKVQCDSSNSMAQSTDKQSDSKNTSNPTKIQMDGSSYVQGKEFILTGLHACGDLTTTMLRVFLSCPEIVGIASVACCYMKLSDISTLSGKDFGYPMSQYLLRSHPDHSLSYEAREMACHFVDSYTERLRENKQSSLKLHCYRAMLQCIIHRIDPSFHHGSVKISVKNGENLDFIQYAKQGLQRLGIKAQVPESLLDEVHSKQSMWKDVVAFYTLRLSLAPVVETLILLDRMLYLWENGLSSTLVPIFDPKISPRNFALLACKKTSS